MRQHESGARGRQRCAAFALCLLHLSACTRTEPVVLPPPGPSVYALDDLTVWTHSGRRIAATEVLGDRDSLWGTETWPGQASKPFSVRVDSIARMSRTEYMAGRTVALVGGVLASVVLVLAIVVGSQCTGAAGYFPYSC
jgi:hypothetical protein